MEAVKRSANWTRENLAWCAGLFEGEGCISCTGPVPKWHLQVTSTDHDVLEAFARKVGMGTIIVGVASPRSGSKKPFWVWRLYGRRQVYAFLVAILPWLGERRSAKAREFFGSCV